MSARLHAVLAVALVLGTALTYAAVAGVVVARIAATHPLHLCPESSR